MCSVCCPKLNRPLTWIPSTTCKSLVHKNVPIKDFRNNST